MTRHVLTVPGKPETQGDMAAFQVGGKIRVVHKKSAKLKEYRERVAWTAKAAGIKKPLSGPVHLDATFVMQRPLAHYKARRRSEPLREDAPSVPMTPDLDKLQRGLYDALTGPVLEDDNQVVSVSARRIYGSPEVQIAIQTLETEESLSSVEKMR